MPSPVALITGATAGIGRATAYALGRAGYRIGVCARQAPDVAGLVAELRDAGIEAAGLPADVADPVAIEALVRHVEQSLGPVTTLVNNAGVLIAKPFEALTLDDWDTTMATNVRGMFIVTRAVLPGMRAGRRGDIVNVASLAGRNGFVGGTAYAASKHAVLGFSRSLMLETRRDGIRVITICPGSVDTAMLRDQSMLAADAAKILRPDDVAGTIAATLALPDRALVSELDIRPRDP